jgi:hypothetical protein
MRQSGGLREGLLSGALAGLVGGLVFGASMLELGLLPTIASLLRADSPIVGFVVQIIIASIIGSGFGLVVWRQRRGAGETLFWGLTYGLSRYCWARLLPGISMPHKTRSPCCLGTCCTVPLLA